jgi:multiple sugar transport system permease protein
LVDDRSVVKRETGNVKRASQSTEVSGARRWVPTALAYGFLVAGLLGGVGLAGWQVDRAADDLLRAEAAVGGRAFEATRDSATLSVLLGSRWRITGAADESLEEAAVRRMPDGPVGWAAIRDAEGWDVVGRLEVDERDGRRAGGLSGLVAAIAAALLLAPVSLWWSRRRRTPGLVASLLVAAPLVLADREASRRLAGLSDERLALGSAALSALPDIDPVLAQPGGVQLLTGLPHIHLDSAAAAVTGLPSATAQILRAPNRPTAQPPNRYHAEGVIYALTDVGQVRLVLLPYEHTHRAGPALALIALAGLVLAALSAALARLAALPRVFRGTVTAWSFLAPTALHLAVFTVGPLAFAGWLSLHRWSLLDAARPFVGFSNYGAVLTDSSWWNAIRNTLVFSLHVPAAMALALALALLTRRATRGVVALRAVFFLPTLTSLVAVSIVWQWMFHSEYGLLNAALGLVGIGPVPWLISPRTALPALMLMGVWLVVGYQMVLFQAGLAAIPQELYDAARMDGAGRWRRFLHVTLPGLRPTLFFVLVTSIIGSFQIFGAVYVMTEGGPLHATDVAVYHIYQEAWEFFRFGRAAAMSWILFGLIFVVTWAQFRVVERRVGG